MSRDWLRLLEMGLEASLYDWDALEKKLFARLGGYPEKLRQEASASLDLKRALEAAYLCTLSYRAYREDSHMVRELLENGTGPLKYKYRDVYFLELQSLLDYEKRLCSGFLASTDTEVMIVIRGSASLEDWFHNVLAGFAEDGLHIGFAAYVKLIQEQLTTYLSEPSHLQKRLLITGHSLGGAIASILTYHLEQAAKVHRSQNDLLETYTFGAPRIGSEQVKLAGRLFRFCNAGDMVPYLPHTAAKFRDLSYEYFLTNGFKLYKIDGSREAEALKTFEVLRIWREKKNEDDFGLRVNVIALLQLLEKQTSADALRELHGKMLTDGLGFELAKDQHRMDLYLHNLSQGNPD